MEKTKIKAHSAVLIANVIFGLGVPVTKLLLDDWVSPMAYMASRFIGATIIFWLVSLFLPREHVYPKDLLVIMAGGLLGFVISLTLSAWALNYTTPVYFSFIASLTPVATMALAALLRTAFSLTALSVEKVMSQFFSSRHPLIQMSSLL